MIVRNANIHDCKIVYEWRNDKVTREMFFDNKFVSYEKHIEWYSNTLSDPFKFMYIGELEGDQIGVCRFDQRNKKFKISININPKKRGMGLGKIFLNKAIDYFFIENDGDLIAEVKINNIASNKLFKSVGFERFQGDKNRIMYMFKQNSLSFKSVTNKDIKVLYEILKKRTYSISHNSLPTFENHKMFVLSNPYRYWYIIFDNEIPEGTFYIQHNNSVGINILRPSLKKITRIHNFINNEFQPNLGIPSIIPNYFYINVAEKNITLAKILEKLGYVSIQKSYKLNYKG